MSVEAFPEDQPPINQLSQNLAVAIQEGTQATVTKLNSVEHEIIEGQAAHGLMHIKAFSEEGTMATQRLLAMLGDVGTDYFEGQQALSAATMLEDASTIYSRGHHEITEGYEIAYSGGVSAYVEVEGMAGSVINVINQVSSQNVMADESPIATSGEEVQAQAPDEAEGGEDGSEEPTEQKLLIESTTAKGQEAINSITDLGKQVYGVRDSLTASKVIVEELPLPSQVQNLVSELTEMLGFINTGNAYYAEDAQQYASSILELITKIDASVTGLITNQHVIGENVDLARSSSKNVADIIE